MHKTAPGQLAGNDRRFYWSAKPDFLRVELVEGSDFLRVELFAFTRSFVDRLPVSSRRTFNVQLDDPES